MFLQDDSPAEQAAGGRLERELFLLSPGSGRVTFNNQHSYLKAVSAAFVEIKTTKFTKKVSQPPCSALRRPGLCWACPAGPKHTRAVVVGWSGLRAATMS